MTRRDRMQETERLREALGGTPAEPGVRGGCPPAGELREAVAGNRSPEQVRELAFHAMACPRCARAWRLARELRAEFEGPRVSKDLVSRFRRVWGSSRTWWALAAASFLVAAVGAGFYLSGIPGRPPAPVYREPSEQTITSLEGARYSVRVATEDLETVATADGIRETEFRVPEDAIRGFPSGARLVWQVKAVLPDGRSVRSRSFTARLE